MQNIKYVDITARTNKGQRGEEESKNKNKQRTANKPCKFPEISDRGSANKNIAESSV